MVSGLVEHEHVVVADQQAREVHAAALATRKLAHRALPGHIANETGEDLRVRGSTPTHTRACRPRRHGARCRCRQAGPFGRAGRSWCRDDASRGRRRAPSVPASTLSSVDCRRRFYRQYQYGRPRPRRASRYRKYAWWETLADGIASQKNRHMPCSFVEIQRCP